MDSDGYDPRVTPWTIDDGTFPAGGPFAARAEFLVGCAVLAPSGHNTQPWRFAISEPDVLVTADPERRLPVADPDDRELTMSLGAAVMNLRVAAARWGLGADVAPVDGPAVRMRLGEADPDARLASLFPALAARRTWRLAMDDRPLDETAAAALRAVSVMNGARAVIVPDGSGRETLTRLIHAGDLARMSDKAFRRELAHWMRPAHTKADDGLAGDSLGLSAFASDLASFTTGALDMGKSVAAKDVALARHSAGLVVVLADDAPASLIDAGQLLEQLLLTATLNGVSASFFNLAVEVPELRARMQEALGTALPPQLLFRIGYPSVRSTAMKASARRPVSAVIADGPRVGAAGDLGAAELQWVAGGTQPSEDEPFLSG